MSVLLALVLSIQTLVTVNVRGVATWYGTGPGRGHAAAGPVLRHALGSNWRGQRVRVCRYTRCIYVRVTDWCRCPYGRVIDLSDEDFRTFAPLWRGVITVRVSR